MKLFKIIGLCSILMTADCYAQTGTFRVEGIAMMSEKPELLNIQIPIEAKNASYEACSSALTAKYNELSNALNKAGIDSKSIKASGLSISEHYTYTDRERKKDGYSGRINVTLKMPHTDKALEAFMKTMAQEQFNFGYQLGFALSEAQKASLNDKAIQLAVNDAKTKAKALASELEVRLLGIKEVIYTESHHIEDRLMRNEYSKMSADMESVELNPNDVEIRKAVTVIWHVSQ